MHTEYSTASKTPITAVVLSTVYEPRERPAVGVYDSLHCNSDTNHCTVPSPNQPL